MEGFLFKKGGKKDSTFGRRNWKKRWFILDGVDLKYYEDFDLAAAAPTELKGQLEVKEGCEISVIDHRDKKFVFGIQNPEESKPFLVAAETERLMKIWMAALKQASSGDCFGANYREYYEMLGLSELDDPSVAVINRAYRKAALRAHPDKGGDIVQFKKLQEAYEMLISKVEEEEKDRLCNEVTFEAVIQKGGQGVGFGMIVVEDPKKSFIYIKDILPTMRLQHLGEAAGGALHQNDRLIAVEKDDVTTWPLARVVQRLNDFRVPVDSSVKLLFSRKVPKSEEEIREMQVEQEQAGVDEEDGPSSATRVPKFSPEGISSSEVRYEHQRNAMEEDEYGDEADDLKEDDSEHGNEVLHRHPSSTGQSASGRPRVSSEADRSTPLAAAASSGAASAVKSRQVHEVAARPPQPRVIYEDERDLLRELNEKLQQSENNVTTLKEAVKIFKRKDKEHVKEVEKLKKEVKRLKAKNTKLSNKLRDVAAQNQVTAEQLFKAKSATTEISRLVESGRELPVTDGLEAQLRQMGLGENVVAPSHSKDGSSSQVSALRQAYIAAASVDPSGSALERWAASGNSAADMLKKLEERMSQSIASGDANVFTRDENLARTHSERHQQQNGPEEYSAELHGFENPSSSPNSSHVGAVSRTAATNGSSPLRPPLHMNTSSSAVTSPTVEGINGASNGRRFPAPSPRSSFSNRSAETAPAGTTPTTASRVSGILDRKLLPSSSSRSVGGGSGSGPPLRSYMQPTASSKSLRSPKPNPTEEGEVQ